MCQQVHPRKRPLKMPTRHDLDGRHVCQQLVNKSHEKSANVHSLTISFPGYCPADNGHRSTNDKVDVTGNWKSITGFVERNKRFEIYCYQSFMSCWKKRATDVKKRYPKNITLYLKTSAALELTVNWVFRSRLSLLLKTHLQELQWIPHTYRLDNRL